MSLRNFFYTLGATSLVVLWTYWTTLGTAANRWINDVQYSHGWLIPFFSLLLLYIRRDMLEGAKLAPSWWCMPFLFVALALRWIEVHFFYNGLDPLSLVPMFAGLVIAVGGWPAFRWAWPAVLFLIFMVPLPYMLHTGMSTQLQGWATSWSTNLLQTLGLPAVAEGTVIKIDEAQVNVAEACSGLGMIVTFFAISAAAAILITSQWWVKVGLLLGAIPLSLICNTVRISTVAMFAHYGHFSRDEIATIDFRIGTMMIPLGCGLIFVELYVLDRIVVASDNSPEGDLPLSLYPGSA